MSIENIKKDLQDEKEVELTFTSSWLYSGLANVYGGIYHENCKIETVLEMRGVFYSYLLPVSVFFAFIETAEKIGAGKAYHAIIRGRYDAEKL